MNDKYYEVRYSFSSQLGDCESDRYITTYNGDIIELDYQNGNEIIIGKVTVKLLQLALAEDEDYSIYDILDAEGSISKIGGEIWDYDAVALNLDIQEFYDNEVFISDICILDKIEIIETHRNKGIGKKVVKDVFNRIASNCGLFVIQIFPIQFEEKSKNEKKSDWESKMKFDELEKDYEKAFYQLKAFYQNVGFDHIDGYEELMFLNPLLRNDRLNSIKFE